MAKRTRLNKFLIMLLLSVSILCLGLFVACSTPKKPDNNNPSEPPEPMSVVIDDAYFCKATGRLMASNEVGGDLIPVSLTFNEGETLTFNGEEGVTIDGEFINSLDRDVEHQLVITKADGKTITYNAKVAERVIVRFADTDKYKNKAVYGSGVGTANDFMYIFTGVNAENATKVGKSIFAFSTTFVNSSCATRWAKSSFDGLYVLANDIVFENEPVVKRNVNMATDSSHNGHWIVDMDGDYLNSIEGKREAAYYVPREGYGFIGTFDGRGKVIDTNNRSTSIGILPPAYGATIINVAIINAYAYYWNSESPLVCSAKNTTFENIYIEYSIFSPSSNTEGNKPMLSCLDNCSLKNFVVYCDLLDATQYLVFGKNLNACENSGYGQGRETTGVFSFVDFCEVNSAGTGVINGHSYSNSVEGDAFNGTTAVNVYTVGSTPLYVNQEMDVDPTTGSAIRPTMRATYFVNKQFKYKSGSKILACDQDTYYDERVFDGTGFESDISKMVKIVQHAKRQRYGVQIFIQVSRKSDFFKLRLINKEGFFDALDMAEMKAQVVKNQKAKKQPFDAQFWKVANDGTVTWKGLK